jgi:hypothetical protein
MERKHFSDKERSNREDGGKTAGRPLRPRRSGEGSESALANLRSIERDRARSVPEDEGATRRK